MLTSTTAYLYVHVTNTSFAFPAFPRNIIMCMQSPHISNVHLKHVAKSILYYYPWLPVTDAAFYHCAPPPVNAHPFLLLFTSFYHCPTLLITAHLSLQSPTAFSHSAHSLMLLSAACYHQPWLPVTDPQLSITAHPLLSMPTLSITVYLIQSLPTASYHCPLLPISITHYGSLLLVDLYSIISYLSVISSTVLLSSYN